MGEAFKTAYYGGCVMGFFLVSLSILVLCTLGLIYKSIRFGDVVSLLDWSIVFEGTAGYGLGGSSVALFCRVGGGIYTKAADVGADLVSKLEFGLEEDDPKNPACIADNVGDNVGDIAGMGADLFGSMAESLCAALLVGTTSPQLIANGGYIYPLLISASGIIVCVLVTYIGFIASDDITTYEDLEFTIKLQLVVSTIILIPTILLLSNYYLPNYFTLGIEGTISYVPNVNKKLFVICPLSGLVSGLLIGFSTEYFTSLSCKPVKDLALGCKEGAAINTILGLALGFMSNVLPTVLIAISLFSSFKIAGMFGIAVSAIGMLANLPICLAIDGYGPISDNAGGLASMCEMEPEVREITDKLDAAGNTTAAIGKGFAIGSACLCAFALYGAFITRTGLTNINLMTPLVMSGILFGAMIPFVFSALTMKAVGTAAEAIVNIIRKDFNDNKHNPDHIPDSAACIQVATTDSLTHMILPGVIVIFTPLLLGLIFGANCVAGYLIGVIVSGIQLAVSASNSGGAWDNTKKLIKNKGLPVKGIERYYLMRKDLKRIKII
jgi:H(+)-translocating pyrophosphatase